MPITVATLQASYLAEFISSIRLEARNHRGDVPNTIIADLTAISTALNVPDPTTHDTTIQAAPIAVRPALIPGPASGRTRFANDVLLHVNQGKCYGQAYLTNAQMGAAIVAAAITAGTANILPPANTLAPAVTGTATVGSTLTTTNGTWTFNPTGFVYTWLRNGQIILFANASTYKLVAADSGQSITARVFASNQSGWGSAISNTVSVA